MQIDIAVKLIKSAKTSLAEYRQTGFADVQSIAKELCEALNIEPELRRRGWGVLKGSLPMSPWMMPWRRWQVVWLKVIFFNTAVDSALRETFTEVKEKCGVLLDFRQLQGMPKDTLQKHCTKLEKTLTAEGESDIDGTEMAQEIMNLPELPTQTTALEVLSFLYDSHL